MQQFALLYFIHTYTSNLSLCVDCLSVGVLLWCIRGITPLHRLNPFPGFAPNLLSSNFHVARGANQQRAQLAEAGKPIAAAYCCVRPEHRGSCSGAAATQAAEAQQHARRGGGQASSRRRKGHAHGRGQPQRQEVHGGLCCCVACVCVCVCVCVRARVCARASVDTPISAHTRMHTDAFHARKPFAARSCKKCVGCDSLYYNMLYTPVHARSSAYVQMRVQTTGW